ncbi:MAG: VCBS repeat-containing protein [Nanoarchaeota archaeon]|nr:VCBS repeat-containing protein [Nanoarchaeota archaeon]
MRKTISPVISVILLIVMTIGAAGLAFFWINNVQTNIQETVGSNVEGSAGGDCTRLNLISIKGDSAVVQNVGCDTIDSVNMLINGVLTEYDLDQPLAPGEVGIITYANEEAYAPLTVEIDWGTGSTQLSSPADENTPEAGYCEPGSCPVDCEESSCSAPYIMFYGAISSNDAINCPCCGDDGYSDYFYNSTHMCSDGGVIFDTDNIWVQDWLGDRIDYASGQDVCELKGGVWFQTINPGFTSSSLGASNEQIIDGRALVLFDIDYDGDLDIIQGEDEGIGTGACVYKWINDGSGSFTRTLLSCVDHYASGSDKINSISFGDINGDGINDFVTTHITGDTSDYVDKWINDGSGSFTTSNIGIDTDYALSSALLDADGDGDLDLLVGGGVTGSFISLWTNNGAGSFTKTSVGSASGPIYSFAVGDVDLDGDVDFLTGDFQQYVWKWINNGAGSFTGTQLDWNLGFIREIAMGDIDGDLDLDVISIDTNGRYYRWRNDGSGGFSKILEDGVYVGDDLASISMGDIDADGDLDFVVAEYTASSNVFKLTNNGAGSFTSTDLGALTDTAVRTITLGDINGDGDLDIIGQSAGPTTSGFIYKWTSNGISSGTGGPCCEVGDTFSNSTNTCTNGVFS